MMRIGQNYLPEHLVFVDEGPCDRCLGRARGYAMRGRRAVKRYFFVRGRRSVILWILLHHLNGIQQILHPSWDIS
jgi:hypothetical protein